MEITDELSVDTNGQEESDFRACQKAGRSLFSGAQLCFALSPLISWLSWDSFITSKRKFNMSLPSPTTGLLGTVMSSWFKNLKEVEEETCFEFPCLL